MPLAKAADHMSPRLHHIKTPRLNCQARGFCALSRKIIDGEGTITLMRKHRNEMHSPEVTVANTSLELLNWLKEKVGSGIIVKKQKKYDRHATAYTWKLRGNNAIQLLEEIKELLVIKKAHAKLITSNYKALTPRNGRYTDDMLQKKMELVAEIRKLNSR